jgi:rod shape-determining protein MreD
LEVELMPIRAILFSVLFIFLGFVLERLPLPGLIDWFTPAWAWLVVTVLVLRAPEYFGLWLAIPIGLLLDIEKFEPFGLNVLLLGLHIVFLQFLYRRIALLNNFVLLTVLVGGLVLARQVLSLVLLNTVSSTPVQVAILQPSLVSMLVWPWIYALVYLSIRKP